MKQPKAIRLIHALSAAELKRFGDFLKSPYFNKSEALINYYAGLKSLHFGKGLTSDVLAEKVWKKAFGKRKFSKSYYDKLNSDLFSQVKSFINHDLIESPDRELEREVVFAEKLQAMGELELFLLHGKKLKEEFRDKITHEPALMPAYIKLEKAIHGYEGRAANANLQELERLSSQIGALIEENFLLEWLKFVCVTYFNSLKLDLKGFMQANRNVLKHLNKRTRSFENEIEQSTNPVIEVYAKIFQLLELWEREKLAEGTKLQDLASAQKMEELFLFLINWVRIYSKVLPLKEIEFIIRFSSGFSTYKVGKKKEVQFLEYMHNLQVLAEESGYFQSGTAIRPDYFYNTIQTAIRVQDLAWAKLFFDKYESAVDGINAEVFIKYALARIHFSNKNYPAAKEILEILLGKIKIPALSWFGRNLLLKTFFELKEYDAFENLIESSRQFFRRQEGALKHFEPRIKAYKLLYRLISDTGESSEQETKGESLKNYLTENGILDPWFMEQLKA